MSQQQLVAAADDLPHFKKSLQIENVLKAKLDVIIRRLRREELKDINIIHLDYQQPLRDTIENAVTRAYMLGAQYVNSSLKRDLKLTHHDIDNIKLLTNEFYSRMNWRIDNYILQRDTRKPDLSDDYITEVFASYVIPRAVHLATVDKTKQILLPPNSWIPKTAAIKQIEKNLIPAGMEPTYLPGRPGVMIVFIWRTANDDRVCLEYCAPLDGAMFTIDDPNIPAPDQSTHPHCRCLLELAEVL